MIYLKLFWTFFKIGAFTFGGGYAMLPLIQQEVLKNGWLSQNELIDFVAISESTPGPFAVNVSTFVGAQTAGAIGALCATLGVVLPSFIIIIVVAKMYERFQRSKTVSGAMIGLKGAVVGLIGYAVISTAISVFRSVTVTTDIKEIVAALILIVGLAIGFGRKVSPIVLIIASAMYGIIVNLLCNFA